MIQTPAAPAPPFHGDPAQCVRYVQPLTLPVRRAEAARISRLSQAATAAGDVHLIMGLGAWRLVWATPADREEGVWIFERTAWGERQVDTWGGVFSDDADRASGVAWATGKGVPLPLARCLATLGVDDGRMP